MHRFKDNIDDANTEPSVRVGAVLPDNTVNLAYVNSPELISEDVVELYDYSNNIPENTTVVEEFEKTFWAGSGRLVKDSSGTSYVPIDNVLFTNYYKELSDGKLIPMYYHYVTRFKHYEKNPPLTTDGAPNDLQRIYLGHNIRLHDNDTPPEGNYIVCLESIGSEEIYKVHIYSDFTSSVDKYYVVEYSKWNATNQIAEHGFEEIYNSEPLFVKAEKNEVLAAEDGSNIFALEKVVTDEGYKVYTAEDIDMLIRNEVLFRWRLREGNDKRSTWKSEYLLSLGSLYEEDFTFGGKTVYTEEDGVAKKTLSENIADEIAGAVPSYSVEYEIWDPDSSSWVQDSSNTVYFEFNGNQLLAWTMNDTGGKIDQPGNIDKAYEQVPVDITIERWLDPPDVTVIPVVKTNVSKTSVGATATSNLNSSQYPYSTSPACAIDGRSPGDRWWGQDYVGAFYVRSDEDTSPPTAAVTVTVNLQRSTDLHKIQVVMGLRGNLAQVRARQSNGTLVTLTLNETETVFYGYGRYYTAENTSGLVSDVTQLLITITPSVWYTRSYVYKRKLWKKYYRDLYQSGFELFEVNAYNYYDPPDIEHNCDTKISLGFSVSKASPYKIDLYQLLLENDMIPEEYTKDNLKYRITLGDTTATTPIPANPYASLSAIKKSSGNLWNWRYPLGRLPDDQDGIYFTYPDITDYSIVMSINSEAEEAYYSRMFSAKNDESGKIFMFPFESMDKDEMWLPKVNNGRMTREKKDATQDLFLDYHLPEYASQAFHPEVPYSYVVKEQAEIYDAVTITVKHTPLHVVCDEDGNPTNIKVYLDIEDVITEIPIINWNMYTGEIRLDRQLSYTDKIYVDYYFHQKHLVYKGYGDVNTSKFYYLDLNPMPGHVYTNDAGELAPSLELLNKSIYFYLVPTYIYNRNTGETTDPVVFSLRHKIIDKTKTESEAVAEIIDSLTYEPTTPSDTTPVEEYAGGVIVIAKVHLKRPAVPSMVQSTDARRRGGGFKDKLSPEAVKAVKDPESSYIWDVGSWDGLPYPSNGVIEITLPQSLLKKHGGKFTEEDILEIINQHVAYGIYVFVQYDPNK